MNAELTEHQDSDAPDPDINSSSDEELDDNTSRNAAPSDPGSSEQAASLDQFAWTPRGSSDADSIFTRSLAVQQTDLPASDPPQRPLPPIPSQSQSQTDDRRNFSITSGRESFSIESYGNTRTLLGLPTLRQAYLDVESPPQRPLPPIPSAQPPTRSPGRLIEYRHRPLPPIPTSFQNHGRFGQPDFSDTTEQDSYRMEFYGGNTPENDSVPESYANLSIIRADGSIHSLTLSEAESRELRAHIRRRLNGKRREIHAQNSPAGSRANPTLGSGPGSSQGSSSFGLESSPSHDDFGHTHKRLRAGGRPIPARAAGGDEDNDGDGDWETVQESSDRSQRLLRRMGTHYEDRSSIADTSYEGSLTPPVTPDLRRRYYHPTSLSRDHTHPYDSSPPILSSRGSPPPKSSSSPTSEHSELPTDGSYGKMTALGTHGNITGIPNRTGMRQVGSSLADNSSQGFERSEVSTASNELRAAELGQAPRLQTSSHTTSENHLADLLTSLRSLPVVRPKARSPTQHPQVPPPATAHEVFPHLHPLPRLPIYLHDTRQALLSQLWLWGLLIPFPMLLLMGHGLWDGVLEWQTGGDVTCIRRREKHMALVLGYGLALCWAVGMLLWMVVRYG